MKEDDQEARRRAYREAWRAVAGEQAEVFDGLSIEEIGVARKYLANLAADKAEAIHKQQAQKPTPARARKPRRR